MKKKIVILISYIILFFNSNLLSSEENKLLKIGLLAPLSGAYEELGKSLLYSLQLALDEINDNNVLIIPRDSGYKNKSKLKLAIEEIKEQGAKVIIGPISNEEFDEVKKYNDIIFLSPSNISPEFDSNIISVGVSLESQLISLNNFIKNQNKKKTIIMFPENQYTKLIERKMNKLNLNYFKIFKYNPDPQVLTG